MQDRKRSQLSPATECLPMPVTAVLQRRHPLIFLARSRSMPPAACSSWRVMDRSAFRGTVGQRQQLRSMIPRPLQSMPRAICSSSTPAVTVSGWFGAPSTWSTNQGCPGDQKDDQGVDAPPDKKLMGRSKNPENAIGDEQEYPHVRIAAGPINNGYLRPWEIRK